MNEEGDMAHDGETKPKKRGIDWGPALLVAGSAAMVLVLALYSVIAWRRTSDVALSGHGIAALLIGVFFTVVIGVGLMVLVFYSARKGFDDGGFEP